MNRSSDSDTVLPGWVRAADGLTLVFALAALYVSVIGGIQIGSIFSMSTPWRALIGLTIVCGLRHYLVPVPAVHQRVCNRLRLAVRPVAHMATRDGQLGPVRIATQLVRGIVRGIRSARVRVVNPRPLPGDTPGAARLEALHVVALWSIAVVQPIFDVVGRSPEFFVAHETQPGDLLALVAVLCLGGPAACLVFIRLVGRVGGAHRRRGAAAAVIGILAGVVALATIKSLGGLPGGLMVGLAAIAAAALAGAYLKFPPIRMFATFLTPAAVVVPVVFLLNPGVGRLLAPAGEAAALEDVTFAATPPVVVVVFDQLQLAALLDTDGQIDRNTFPHFAALADEATWYRNATAVAELTNYALPAILTGNYPSPGTLPVLADHPGNLFTLLGGRYRLHVEEPLTELCPETLCAPERATFGGWLAGVMRDLAVVYLTVVLPDDLSAQLPPVNQTWNDFAANETFQNRWRAARVDDRRDTVNRFIESVTATTEPVLHFLHVLLPHEPWLYLPTGQQFTFQRHNVGLREGKWAEDRWAAALNYQRYLLQVEYVDTLLGRLAGSLRDAGIYDDALIVVTADHGASLRPGSSFRRPDESSFADVASVPLFVKRPAQRRGGVVDANIEVIDILPTIAAELGVALPWTTDGDNALDPAHAPRPTKLMFFDGARNRMEGPGDLRAALLESAARKFEWIETGDPLETLTPDGRYGNLIGSAADELRTARPSAVEVVVDALPLLRDVDLDADFIPAHITGAVAGLQDGAPVPALAIAINGVVAAVTRPYAFPVVGRRAAWEAIVHPRRFVPGPNTLEVFEIREDSGDGAVTLAATRGDMAIDSWPNLVRTEEIEAIGGQASGFYGTEWAGVTPFRWTRGDARLLLPLDPRAPPSALAVNVLMTGGQKQLHVMVDGCTLFDQIIQGRWTATFDLGDCRLVPPDIEIALLSDTHSPETSDSRNLGVGVGRVELRGAATAQ